MMKKRSVFLLGIVIALTIAASPLQSQRANRVEKFMQAKLENAQQVLEALATEDYRAIAKHSQELSLLSHAANWQVLQTRDYQRHSEEFRRHADALTKAGQEENLDGATLSYMQLTLSCVNCHKYVRSTRVGGHPTTFR